MASINTNNGVSFPIGTIPTMITPFIDNNSNNIEIDYNAIDGLLDFYIGKGCVGIFSPCLSSEMFDLSSSERLELAKYIFTKVNGRIVVVSTGTYDGKTIEEQGEFINEMSKYCDAVVINTSTLVPKESSEIEWKTAMEAILSLTGDVKLGLYECPVPYKRLLSPDLIEWCAATNRFYFHKDTSCLSAEIKAKVKAVSKHTNFRFYNANVETLLTSLRDGGHGFSGISANFYPQLHVWLCKHANVHSNNGGDDKVIKEKQLQKVQDFLSLAEATVCINYPASAKAYLCRHLFILNNHICRTKGPDGNPKGKTPFLEHQIVALNAMRRMEQSLSKELGIV